ncbi:MAG: hypothetical protein OEO23_15645, partial [Gemmatimonadota bacterium]|nr:hypothetical protein [Gemmatimonadota bacterium]
YLGGMATSRIDGDGLYNVTYGLDSQLRLFGDEYLTVKWLQTFQGGDGLRDAAPAGLDAARVIVDWTRRNLEGLSYQNAFVWSGPGYDPAVGFESRSDFLRAQSDWNYQWYPDAQSSFRRIWAGVESNAWIRNEDDNVDTGQITPFLQLETKPGTSLKASINGVYEDVVEPFALTEEVSIPEGSYWAPEAALELRAARGWTVRPNVTLTAGRFFDGNRIGIETDYNWAVGPHLELRGGWEWNRIRFPDRDQAFDSHLARVQAQTAIDSRFSINTFVQYNSLTDAVTTNARFRYNFREGQDLWLVWNEGLNLDRDAVLGVPRRPFEGARTLTVKYTHTFIF